MSILSGLGDILLGGGASGLLSGAVGILGKLAELKETNAHERAKWDYTIAMTRANAEHEMALADKELLIGRQQGADSQRLAAIQAEGALSTEHVSRWVNDLRSLNRPILTYALLAGAFWMHWIARGQAEAGVAPSEMQLYLTVFVTNAAASAIGFWFGDRVVSGPMPKGNHR